LAGLTNPLTQRTNSRIRENFKAKGVDWFFAILTGRLIQTAKVLPFILMWTNGNSCGVALFAVHVVVFE